MAATMTAQNRQHEVEEIAFSLSETLALYFPQGPPAHDEKLVKHWLQELSDASEDITTDMANEIMRLAVQKWKSRQPATTTPESASETLISSFSLLDQLSSMPKRIFFVDIQAASTPEERLLLVQQVDHVDDVASDWKKILKMLYNGLTEGDYVSDYIALHRKWFDQCCGSFEYTSIQFTLCSNLVQALRHFFGTHVFVSEATTLELSNQLELPYNLMQQWHVMWMTSMKQFRLDDCNQMACDMMQLMRKLAPFTPAKFLFLPAHAMALIDPYAEWFALWIRHAVSPSDALKNLFASGLFHDLMQRCLFEGSNTWKTEPSMMDTSNTIVIQEGNDAEVLKLQRALWVQSLCMLRSILVCSRVALFPWDEVTKTGLSQAPYSCLLEPVSSDSEAFKPAIRKETPHKLAVRMIECYLKMLNKSAGSIIRAVCFEAIETILCGFQDDPKFAEFEEILKEYEIIKAVRKEFYISR